MKKFEYKIKPKYRDNGVNLYDTDQKNLNDFGKDGWELVAVDKFYYYLKREIK